MVEPFPPEIKKLLDLSQQISSLMEDELELIRAKDTKALGVTQIKKEHLTTLYGLQMESLKKQPHLIKGLDQQQKEELVKATEALQAISETNATLLKAIYDTSHRIMLVLLEIAQQQQKNLNSYDVSGHVAPQKTRVYGCNATALTLDQRL